MGSPDATVSSRRKDDLRDQQPDMFALSSLENFRINQPADRMPDTVIRAFGYLKGAAAAVNVANNILGKALIAAISVSNDGLMQSHRQTVGNRHTAGRG